MTARAGGSEMSTQLTVLPNVEVPIVGLDAAPNPVSPGQTVTIAVTIAVPAVQSTGVVLTADQQPFGTIPIEAGVPSGQIQLVIPEGVQPMSVVLSAVSGQSHAETTLQIGP